MRGADSGITEGERLKAEALALLEARRELYVLRGRRALLLALLATGEATADAVRNVVKLPPGIDPKLFGSVPGALARGGIIRKAGFTESDRPQAHRRPILVWQLADPAAARRWLATHPDRQDPQSEIGGAPTLPIESRPSPRDSTPGEGSTRKEYSCTVITNRHD